MNPYSFVPVDWVRSSWKRKKAKSRKSRWVGRVLGINCARGDDSWKGRRRNRGLRRRGWKHRLTCGQIWIESCLRIVVRRGKISLIETEIVRLYGTTERTSANKGTIQIVGFLMSSCTTGAASRPARVRGRRDNKTMRARVTRRFFFASHSFPLLLASWFRGLTLVCTSDNPFVAEGRTNQHSLSDWCLANNLRNSRSLYYYLIAMSFMHGSEPPVTLGESILIECACMTVMSSECQERGCGGIFPAAEKRV